MTGVAQAADSIEDLAAFIGGEPDEAHADDEQADDSQPDEGVGETEDASDESPEKDPNEDNPEDEEDAEDQTSELIEVPGEDGQTEKVAKDELIAGYMRQKAFTQKTMELGERERQAAQVVQQRVQEASQYALQQAQMAKAAVLQLAGIKSEDELAMLAQTDPHAWIQEQQRLKQVGGVLQHLEQVIATETQRKQQAELQAEQQKIAAAWQVLNEKGIDQKKLGDLYGRVMKDYGVTSDQLGKVLEPGLALALKDAIAYRELQAKKPQISQKVKEADRLPTQKKALPANERKNRVLNEKFSKGRAKVNDLAAFLAANSK